MKLISSFCAALAVVFLFTTADAVYGHSAAEYRGNVSLSEFMDDNLERIVYKKSGDTPMYLYCAKPEALKVGDKRTAVVIIHGGGWTGGETLTFAPHARYFASRGAVAFCVDYRLVKSGVSSVADCIADCKSAIRYIRAHALELGVDPEKIVVFGDSAGGHLSACMGTVLGVDDPADNLKVSDAPNMAILCNPLTDFTTSSFFKLIQGSSDKQRETLAKKLSPLYQVRKNNIHTLIMHGDADNVIDISQSKQLYQKMKSVGNDCEMIVLPNTIHAFICIKWRAAENEVVDNLKKIDDYMCSRGFLQGKSNLVCSVPMAWIPKGQAPKPLAPYSPEGNKRAKEAIKGSIAICAHSRYAFIDSHKVRLDNNDILRCYAILKDGVIYVPESFTGALTAKDIQWSPIPAELSTIADKWVYELSFDKAPSEIKPVVIGGKSYIDIEAVAKSLKKHTFRSGELLLISENPIKLPDDKPLGECITTIFDMPERFVDPTIASRTIPSLKAQKEWTQWVKVSKEQMAYLTDSTETKWATPDVSSYDLTGFNTALLGSKVPAPGVYPRLFFSEQDIPAMANRIKSSQLGQKSLIEMEVLFKKSWWNPSTSDGEIFKKLYTGDIESLEWAELPAGATLASTPHLFRGQKPSIYNSHVAYVPECLSTMALYCLLTNDDEHGRQAAAATANYFRLREELIDELNSCTDEMLGSNYVRPDGTIAEVNGALGNNEWRGMHGVVPNMNMGVCLDFAGKWMSAEQIDLMRRVIVKATYGRRPYAQNGPMRFRDTNWCSWDLPAMIALTAIEGLPGFDPEAMASNRETVKAFLDFGIDGYGQTYESNGKSGGGLQSLILSMVSMARRGDNLFAHPHLIKLAQAQVMVSSPTGRSFVTSGTQYMPYSSQLISVQFLNELKAFYPNDKSIDYLLGLSRYFSRYEPNWKSFFIDKDFSPEKYRKQVEATPRLRLPSPTYPAFTRSVLWDTDYNDVKRTDLGLPLDFVDNEYGILSAYSDHTKDGVWMNMQVRDNHYIGAGHHHSDAGMFHFAALGVDWITESPFSQVYDGFYHNLVQVNGISTPGQFPARAHWKGATVGDVSTAKADLTYTYTYRWCTQPSNKLSDEFINQGWEMEPDIRNLKMFASTSRMKMRPWWASYNQVNFMATARAKFNPMEYVYRSVALVRGKHAYGIVVDELKKDDKEQLYEWTANLSEGIWLADVKGLQAGQIALAYRDDPLRMQDPKENSVIIPKEGEPILIVAVVGANTTPKVQRIAGAAGRKGEAQYFDIISIPLKAVEANYRVLLLPAKYGQPYPLVRYNEAKQEATIVYEEQKDIIKFSKGDNRQSTFVVKQL